MGDNCPKKVQDLIRHPAFVTDPVLVTPLAVFKATRRSSDTLSWVGGIVRCQEWQDLACRASDVQLENGSAELLSELDIRRNSPIQDVEIFQLNWQLRHVSGKNRMRLLCLPDTGARRVGNQITLAGS